MITIFVTLLLLVIGIVLNEQRIVKITKTIWLPVKFRWINPITLQIDLCQGADVSIKSQYTLGNIETKGNWDFIWLNKIADKNPDGSITDEPYKREKYIRKMSGIPYEKYEEPKKCKDIILATPEITHKDTKIAIKKGLEYGHWYVTSKDFYGRIKLPKNIKVV